MITHHSTLPGLAPSSREAGRLTASCPATTGCPNSGVCRRQARGMTVRWMTPTTKRSRGRGTATEDGKPLRDRASKATRACARLASGDVRHARQASGRIPGSELRRCDQSRDLAGTVMGSLFRRVISAQFPTGLVHGEAEMKKRPKVRIHGRRLKGGCGPKYAPFGLRRAVYKRDAGQCQYCGAEVAMADCNIDHVFPYQSGGPTRKSNLVVACRRCNELKFSQIIPEGFGPLDGGAEKMRRKASRRMKETISVIRLASSAGVYLDDLFTEATQEAWGLKG